MTAKDPLNFTIEPEPAIDPLALQVVMTNVTHGLSWVDEDLIIRTTNRKFCELLDLPEDLVKPGVPLETVFRYNAERGEYGPGDLETQVRERLELAGKFEPHSFERERGDGSILRIEGYPVPEGGFVTIYSDVTELRRNERDLEKARAELAEINAQLEARIEQRSAEVEAANLELSKGERLAALGQLTATVTHELRNPLGALRTSLYLVETKTQDKDLGIERAMGRATRSIQRCDRIITEMLDYARSSEIRGESGNPDSWLDEVLEDQHPPMGIRVERRCADPETELPFDPERLRRAVINIFENGCHAMSEDRMKSGDAKDHCMTVESACRGDRFEMRFIDNGPGMDSETIDKIFEPLFSTKSFGTGLGMPTVKQIMELHGGGIEVSSTPGEGTEVLLWLPTADAKSKGKAA